MPRILLVDDEPGVIEGQRNLLNLNGFENIYEASGRSEARSILENQPIDLILLDLTLKDGSGREILEDVTSRFPSTAVIVVTGAAEVSTAVDCMRVGAYDFLVKGTDTNRLAATVRNALERQRTERENRLLREAFHRNEPRHSESFKDFITRSHHIQRVFVYLDAIASLPDPILIFGETGVGKELIARGVHRASGRSGEFVAVNMAGVDDQVFSDTMFGHTRGSFTGANQPRSGLIRSAADGTLFLDEIGDMPIESQARLLRLLDSGEFRPLGSDRSERASARFVFATNQNLERAVEEGRFRRDLYYRISTHNVTIPPLRERPEDIEAISAHLINTHAKRIATQPSPLSQAEQERIENSPLFGNVRELEQIILRSLLAGRHVVPDDDRSSATEAETMDDENDDTDSDVIFGTELPTPDTLIRQLFEETDRRHPDSRSDAAAAIGLSPQAFANRWRRLVKTDTTAESN